jgi:hypothetical protein
MTSRRVAARLQACSTTPRTRQRYLEELACDGALHEQLYEEGKLALAAAHVELAATLFAQCPGEYRHVATYQEQCARFMTFCELGIIARDDTAPLRDVVARILGLDTDAIPVVKYSESLRARGYSAVSVEALTLSVSAPLLALVSDEGHRLLFEQHAVSRSPWWERTAASVERVVARCGGLDRCLARAERLGRTTTAVATAPDDGDATAA